MKVQDLNKTILEYDTTGKPLSAMPTEELKMLWSKCDCKDHSCTKCMAIKHNLLQRKAQAKESVQTVSEGQEEVIEAKLKICKIMCDKLKDAIEYPGLNVAFENNEADELYKSLSTAKDIVKKVHSRMLDNRQWHNRKS